MSAGTRPHPAPFSEALLPIFAGILDEHRPRRRQPLLVLDPFAGIGRVHRLRDLCERPTATIGIEIEPEWARAHKSTHVGDATRLYLQSGFFDAVVTSPCYGNRMADHHDARDACSECEGYARLWVWTLPDGSETSTCPKCKGTGLSPRRTYRAFLGRPVSDGSAASMQWGDAYRELHERAWREARRVLRPGGLLVLNIKDHVRDGERQYVTRWHRATLRALGFRVERERRLELAGFRHGENSTARVRYEHVIAFTKRGRS